MSDTLQFYGPQYCFDSFTDLAVAEGLDVRLHQPSLLSREPTNCIDSLLVSLNENGPGVASGVGVAYVTARVIIAWLHAQAERRVIVTKEINGETVNIDLKGYSPDDIKAILRDCRNLTIYQPPKKQQSDG